MKKTRKDSKCLLLISEYVNGRFQSVEQTFDVLFARNISSIELSF